MKYELFEELTGNKVGDYPTLKEIAKDLKSVGVYMSDRYEAISKKGMKTIFTGHIQRGRLIKY